MTSVTDIILARLPSAYDKSSGSNNRKLIKPIGDECDEFYVDILDTKEAHFIDLASGASLDKFGKLLQTFRTTSETDDHYRARLKSMFSRYAGSGTIQNIKDTIGTILSIPTSRVVIEEDFAGSYAQFYITLMLPDITASGLTLDELKLIVNSVKGAGITATFYTEGTFTSRAAGEGNDPTLGYNDIANSNPSGGTYAGFL